MKSVRIDTSWKKVLQQDFKKPYWNSLTQFIRNEYSQKTIFPPAKNIFSAFDLCPFNSVKVVILGQDPYHGERQAHGLSFSVNDGIPLPPSLQNIYKEIRADLGITPLTSGDLSRWAKQGVLLLNSVLTVRAGMPASHAGIGWEDFTDTVIKSLNDKRENIVYMLWGKYAQSKGVDIDKTKNLVLSSGHPSPFSAHLFFDNHHFTECNNYLTKHKLKPIDWK